MLLFDLQTSERDAQTSSSWALAKAQAERNAGQEKEHVRWMAWYAWVGLHPHLCMMLPGRCEEVHLCVGYPR